MAGVLGGVLSAAGQIIKAVPWRKMRRWAWARDLPPAAEGHYNVGVFDLSGDVDGRNTRHVTRAIRSLGLDVYRVTRAIDILESGSAEENETAALGLLQDLMKQYNVDVAVWGEVLKDGETLLLKVTSRKDEAQGEGTFRINSSLQVPSDFGELVSICIVCECHRQILSAIDISSVENVRSLLEQLSKLESLRQGTRMAAKNAELLTYIYRTSCLTAFDCTLDIQWLAKSLSSGGKRTVGSLPSKELEFYAAVMARAVELLQVKDLAIQLTSATSALVKREEITFLSLFIHGRALRLRSRFEAKWNDRLEILKKEWSVYNYLLSRPDLPVQTRADIQHLKIGIIRDALSARNYAFSSAKLFECHMRLPSPSMPATIREVIETVIEATFMTGQAEHSKQALKYIHKLREANSRKDKLQYLYCRIQEIRCLTALGRGNLDEFDSELHGYKGNTYALGILINVASSEIELKRAASETGLERMKRLKCAQVDAVAAKQLGKFSGQFHGSEHYAKRRFDAAQRELNSAGAQA